MILLDQGNRILAETVTTHIKPPEHVVEDSEGKEERKPVDIRLCDFDDVSYRVVIEASALNTLKVSINLPCYKEIANAGAREAAEKAFPNLLITPDPQYDLTVGIDLQNLPLGADDLIARLKLFKATLVGGAFNYYFDALLSGTPRTSSSKFSLRKDTTVYFFPRADRVTVVYSLDFAEKTDSAIAKIFMQEFVDAKRRLGAAPPCTFGVNPPLELKEFGITEPTGNLGFISFAVMKSHLEGGRKEKVVEVLQVFRNYLQYHIKCSKSYFHSRMRARVVSLLKILARAKNERPEDKKEMKTISGKTFVRN